MSAAREKVPGLSDEMQATLDGATQAQANRALNDGPRLIRKANDKGASTLTPAERRAVALYKAIKTAQTLHERAAKGTGSASGLNEKEAT